MVLFSKILAFFAIFSPKFSERELVFNRRKLQEEISKRTGDLNEFARDRSHQAYTDYVRSLLNLEILKLADIKTERLDTYAYQKGRIDGLRFALDLREKTLLDAEVAKKTHGEQGARRSYVKPPATSAGLSI